ncbi:hypothetical protein [Chelativorans alearense]|uniref:hypothetical protein n=1 Tax=Chelativorans alearense TaxID=2681495 RepID=UPI0013D86C90|nr:hypothetical protein [Chelativorans alearense]
MKSGFTLLLLLPLLLLAAFVWLLYGNQPTPLGYRTSVALHNSDVNYPIFGAIVPTQGDNGSANAYFVDLTDGSRRLLRRNASAFTALRAVPNRPGHFLVVQRRYNKYHLIDYEVETGVTTNLHEFDFEIRSPFMLGDQAYALDPTHKTTKQALNYEVVCGGKILTEPRIKSAFDAASTSRSAAFFGRIVQRRDSSMLSGVSQMAKLS